nr:hypothetical protein [Tanacetum cinerariifolium]
MDKYGTGDSMKTRFWSVVFADFEKELGWGGGTIRGYDTIVAKWKSLIRHKIVAFSVVYDSVQWMDNNESSNLVLFQNALTELENGYGHPFTMETCWRILKNHPTWTEIEMPTFNKAMDKKTTQSNPSTPEKPPMPPISSFSTGGSSSQQHTHQPMSPISLFLTAEESTDEHEIGDEYHTDGYLIEKEQQQLILDEEALRETLEEQARAEKEWKEFVKQEQAHDELFRLEFRVKSDSEYKSD